LSLELTFCFKPAIIALASIEKALLADDESKRLFGDLF